MWDQAASDRGVIERLLQPHTPEEFAEGYYERSPLHIARDRAGYFAEFFGVDELERVLFGTQLRADAVRVNKDGTAVRRDSYARFVPGAPGRAVAPGELLDPDRVAALFARGCSLILDEIEYNSPSLAKACRALETFFRHSISANVYITPADSQGFGPHWDSHDTVILQIEGSKQWRIYQAEAELPLRHQAFDRKIHRAGKVEREVEMRPGDLLYIPRGVMHEAKAGKTFSLHVTLGLYPVLWYDVLGEALASAGEADVLFRRSAEAQQQADLASPEMSAALKRAFSPANLEAAARRVERRFITERRNGLEGQLHQLFALPDLSEDSTVAIRHHMLYHLSDGVDGEQLTFSDKTVRLPKGAAAVVRALEAGPARVGDLRAPGVDALEVVRRLIQDGFAACTV